jgi:U3 small nucleolar RNA-associated protein 21
MDEDANELLHFIRALTSRLVARRDYELTQAWMTVFLRFHFGSIIESEVLRSALGEWKQRQAEECERLDDLVGYCGGVVNFLRSPRA